MSWRSSLKYYRIDPLLRAEKRQLWNQPKLWPLGLLIVLLIVIVMPVILQYWRREHTPRNVLTPRIKKLK